MLTSQITLTTYMILSVVGLAMCAPIHDPLPYDPDMDTVEWLNMDEEVTCLNYQDCMEVFGIEEEAVYSEPLPSIKPDNNKCTVICGNQDNSYLSRCDVPFTILSAISSETVANYTLNDKLLADQIQRYADFVTRSLDINEYEIPAAVLTNTLMQISSQIVNVRDIIRSVEHYLAEVERDTECAVLLDIWLGYKVLKMAGIL